MLEFYTIDLTFKRESERERERERERVVLIVVPNILIKIYVLIN